MTPYRLTVPGIPVGKGRPRVTTVGGKPRMYTPKRTVEFEKAVAAAFRKENPGTKPLDGPVEVRVYAIWEPPKSTPKRRRAEMIANREPRTKKPDADNVLKAVLDALNGVAYHDDAQVCKVSAETVYGDESATAVQVYAMPSKTDLREEKGNG